MDQNYNKLNYLKLLSRNFPNAATASTEIINLEAILNLPKGTEHFLADLHGEYEAFQHVLRNASGTIKRKVKEIFNETLSNREQKEICTLIYYPGKKLHLVKSEYTDPSVLEDWYFITINRLVKVCRSVSSKYTRSKVHKALPADFSYIIQELLHENSNDLNKQAYVDVIVRTIISTKQADDFIVATCNLIQQLTIDVLHILGDVFDRGPFPHKIMDILCNYHNFDIQWGNHDILWMGAASGSEVCIAGVVRNSLRYKNTEVLEKGYAISLRPLTMYAQRIYPDENPLKASEKAISMIMFKLEGQLILRNPDFKMESRLQLQNVDYNASFYNLNGKRYELSSAYFPTVDPKNPYELTDEEKQIIGDLKSYFIESERLQRHVEFIYKKGSVYTCCNQNLLFHGCIPLNWDGTMKEVSFDGRPYKGKSYMDFCDQMARKARATKEQKALDFMWFLWNGLLSPISGREFTTFERMFLEDESTWKEPSDPYYELIDREEICEELLEEFGLNPKDGHIINGHVPVKVSKGETPIKANGKALCIDGGFCRAYHQKTGISGYTLIYNSRGFRLLEHQNVADVREALRNNKDIESVSRTIELQSKITSVGDTDEGRVIQEKITDLYSLLLAYEHGTIKPQDE